ncbi:MAG: hypothetical protein ABUS79_27290, partial [Pseudomonadota bacterium]
MTMLALGFAGFSALATMGCSPRAADGSAALSRDNTGRASIALQLAPGLSVATATYAITGPAGFSRSGSVDVSRSSTLTVLVGNLPAGIGYHVTLTSTASDGTTSCMGAGTFDVAAAQTTLVTVSLDCHQGPTTGSLKISGVTNVCPVVDGISANPAE